MSDKTLSVQNWINPDQKADEVVRQYTIWQGLRSNALEKWREIEAFIYATDTRSPLLGGGQFDHTTHIPLVHEIREDLISIMYTTILPHDDWLGWRGFDKESDTEKKRAKALAYIDNRNSLNGFRRDVKTLVQDYIDYGNAFVKVMKIDETETSEDGSITTGYIGPKLQRISPHDIVFNPTASSFEKTPKIIRTLVSLGDFKTMADNDANRDFNQQVVQDVLDRRGNASSVPNDIGDNKKNEQFIPDGFNTLESYHTSGVVEILWFYGDVYDDITQEVHKNRLVAVVDRGNTLLDIEEVDPKIYHVGYKPKPDNLWAQGALDQVIGLNFQANHRENAKNTAIDRFIYPDRLYVGDAEEIYDPDTGQTKYLVPEGGSVTDITPDASILSFDGQIDQLMAMGRAAARVPPSIVGFRTPGEKTFGEVQSLENGAFRGFIHKAEMFELELLEKVVNAELKIGIDSLDIALQVPSEDSEGLPVFLDITKEDLESNGKLVPYGARRFARENQQLSAINLLANSNLGQLIGSHINTFNLAKAVETLGGFSKFEFVSKFAAVEEALEQQQQTQMAEQVNMDQLQQPSLAELE